MDCIDPGSQAPARGVPLVPLSHDLKPGVLHSVTRHRSGRVISVTRSEEPHSRRELPWREGVVQLGQRTLISMDSVPGEELLGLGAPKVGRSQEHTFPCVVACLAQSVPAPRGACPFSGYSEASSWTLSSPQPRNSGTPKEGQSQLGLATNARSHRRVRDGPRPSPSRLEPHVRDAAPDASWRRGHAPPGEARARAAGASGRGEPGTTGERGEPRLAASGRRRDGGDRSRRARGGGPLPLVGRALVARRRPCRRIHACGHGHERPDTVGRFRDETNDACRPSTSASSSADAEGGMSRKPGPGSSCLSGRPRPLSTRWDEPYARPTRTSSGSGSCMSGRGFRQPSGGDASRALWPGAPFFFL